MKLSKLFQRKRKYFVSTVAVIKVESEFQDDDGPTKYDYVERRVNAVLDIAGPIDGGHLNPIANHMAADLTAKLSAAETLESISLRSLSLIK